MIPLFQPDMPTADELVPYLRQMDHDKWYTNFGPRLASFEELLAQQFNVNRSKIVTLTSATAGLTVALRLSLSKLRKTGSPFRQNFTCLLPAWTFVASAQAVLEAGGQPIFCDVDPVSGALTPSLVEEYLQNSNNPHPDIIMPVAPFGAEIDVRLWDEFSEEKSIPVVVDAAASFCSLTPGNSPAVVSLHATKIFGVGEGGFVVTKDIALAKRIREYTTFGFCGRRVAGVQGGNYKLSEYHAAVGLAQFDRFLTIKSKNLKSRERYVKALSEIPNVRLLKGEAGKYATTFNVIVENLLAKDVVRNLKNAGIDAGIWWEDILPQNPLFNSLSRNNISMFPVSASLYTQVLGVPFSPFLSEFDIKKVAIKLKHISESGS
ncbi:DegT/DnrJ/EryC1/StrS family aminotransferase [Kiloniella antarctica]|uniref:DegT/DnrJ/EryC1/StrS family aminotransferase n=1 Tax=Kiloniella antarctica TaxID=1550907 RepID=A0ABW5BSX2_9PROT